MDILQPTFGDTKSYQQIRDFSDTAVSGLRFISKLVFRESGVKSENEVVEVFANGGERKSNMKDVSTAKGLLPEKLDEPSIDVFNL